MACELHTSKNAAKKLSGLTGTMFLFFASLPTNVTVAFENSDF